MSSPDFRVVECPHCGKSTRLPESLRGQPVRCPLCNNHFRIDGDPTSPQVEKLFPTPPKSTSPTLLPGLLLLLVGAIGLLCDGALVILASVRKDQIVEEVLRQAKDPDTLLKRWLDIPKDFDPEEFREQTGERVELARRVHFAFAMVSLLIVLGGIGTLRQRWYRLAQLSCFLAMLNLGFFCCLMGVPVGLFGLVKLLDPEVRQLFR